MIPKIIHCCWFGGAPIPKSVQSCINTWKRHLPDYEIMIWTEKEFNPKISVPYVSEAYECGKFAFVSDYVRLYALYKFGGVYLDTDVEVIRPFEPMMSNNAFMCFESKDRLSTATIAASPSSDWVLHLLKSYETRHFLCDGKMDLTTNVEYISQYFVGRGLTQTGEFQVVDDVAIYPSEYFSPKSWGTGKYNVTSRTIAIHHFAGTWHSRSTRFLSFFFSNNAIVTIASLKEKIINFIKYVLAKG